MADVTISQLSNITASDSGAIPISINNTTFRTAVSSIIDTIGLRTSGIQLPAGTTSQRPSNISSGLFRFNTTLNTIELYHPTGGWVSIPIAGTDTGSGQGLTAWQGADANNAIGVTTVNQLKYVQNLQNQPGSYIDIFNYTCPGGSNFAVHTGHQANWWPVSIAVQVSSSTPKVLNQIQWYRHFNGCGNVDVYGSNQEINSNNAFDLSRYTYLGRVYMYGRGYGSDCNLITAPFNINNFGYRWYNINIADSSNIPLPDLQIGDRVGFAMFGMRLNKV